MEYVPIKLFELSGFTIKDGKLNSRFSKMKDGKFIKSFYKRLNGLLIQKEITEEEYEKIFLIEKE